MPENRKRRWIDALRSGKYPQTKGTFKQLLDDKECFCATGVLADIINPELLKAQTFNRGYFLDGRVVEKMYPKGYSRLRLQQGASDRFTLFGLPKGQFRKIVKMNDAGESFQTIANWIEKNVKSR